MASPAAPPLDLGRDLDSGDRDCGAGDCEYHAHVGIRAGAGDRNPDGLGYHASGDFGPLPGGERPDRRGGRPVRRCPWRQRGQVPLRGGHPAAGKRGQRAGPSPGHHDLC